MRATSLAGLPRIPAAIVLAVPVVTGVCDTIENVLTLRMLEREPADGEALTTSALTSVRWAGLSFHLVALGSLVDGGRTPFRLTRSSIRQA